MLALTAATGFVGYLLAYAAAAHSGRYAAKPWDALTDTGAPSAAASGHTGGGGGTGILGKIIGIVHWLPIGLPFP